jgi:hypothetical protein
MTKNAKIALGVGLGGLLIFSFIPIWSCGLRKGLNFYEFALAHTILMHQPIQYIPEEKYTKPLTRDELDKLNALFEAAEIVKGHKVGEIKSPLVPATISNH